MSHDQQKIFKQATAINRFLQYAMKIKKLNQCKINHGFRGKNVSKTVIFVIGYRQRKYLHFNH